MIILKEEINQLSSEHLALARWKLIVVGAASVFGFGWGQGGLQPGREAGILMLCFVGFLCLYIDLLIYRRNTAIHAIGHYLRNYQGSDPETNELRDYELRLNSLRKSSGIFYSERWAQVISSIVFSTLLPGFGYVRYGADIDWRLCIPSVAIVLQLLLYLKYSKNRDFLTSKESSF